jgi:hypothetical protein
MAQGVDWQRTKILHLRLGRFAVRACRQRKHRDPPHCGWTASACGRDERWARDLISCVNGVSGRVEQRVEERNVHEGHVTYTMTCIFSLHPTAKLAHDDITTTILTAFCLVRTTWCYIPNVRTTCSVRAHTRRYEGAKTSFLKN